MKVLCILFIFFLELRTEIVVMKYVPEGFCYKNVVDQVTILHLSKTLFLMVDLSSSCSYRFPNLYFHILEFQFFFEFLLGKIIFLMSFYIEVFKIFQVFKKYEIYLIILYRVLNLNWPLSATWETFRRNVWFFSRSKQLAWPEME